MLWISLVFIQFKKQELLPWEIVAFHDSNATVFKHKKAMPQKHDCIWMVSMKKNVRKEKEEDGFGTKGEIGFLFYGSKINLTQQFWE